MTTTYCCACGIAPADSEDRLCDPCRGSFLGRWPGRRRVGAPSLPTLEEMIAVSRRLAEVIGPPTPETDRLIESMRLGREHRLDLASLCVLLKEREAAGRHAGERAAKEAAARAFWRGVCAQRAADLDERAETIHREALRACQAGDPSGNGPRGGRGIGGGQTTRAFYLRCDAKQLREWAGAE